MLFLYKYLIKKLYIVLLDVNSDPSETFKLVNEICGKPFSWLKRIRTNNFGSSKYLLNSINKNKFNIDIENYNNTVGVNFDLREKGIVFFFRYNNNEFVEACIYPKITIQSNDNVFVIQTDKNLYKFDVLNTQNHLKFVKNFFNYKNTK